MASDCAISYELFAACLTKQPIPTEPGQVLIFLKISRKLLLFLARLCAKPRMPAFEANAKTKYC